MVEQAFVTSLIKSERQMTHDHPPSWPGSSRPSTSFLRQLPKKDVDARDKPGHDDLNSILPFFERPVSAVLTASTIAAFAWPAFVWVKRRMGV
ncbi:hypothetical protein [Bradyrhizobium sp.]|jgi:hypothetical protein|uniref:hypothetical protein n=1 Tax=Bradyrhizobium sp. TaxID=376 RepID=UPI002E08E9F0|nr:hypothetical protein [Bradyrhizobium sp.]